MPIFINHRINTVSKLLKLKDLDGCETDVRDFKKKLVLSHDPFQDGEDFKKFLKYTKNKVIFLNIKSCGIINEILAKTKNNNRLDELTPIQHKFVNISSLGYFNANQ